MVSISDVVNVCVELSSEVEGLHPRQSPPGMWPSTAVLTIARSQVAHMFTARVGSGSDLAVLEVCGLY